MNNVIYCNYYSYRYFEDYILSILSKIDCEVLLYINYQGISLDNKKRNIFIQSIPEKLLDSFKEEDNVYLLNTEQMCRTYDDWKDKTNAYPGFIKMIDFSKENIKYYIDREVYYLPYQVNDKEIYDYPKDFGICIMASGDGNLPEYRKKIYDELQNKGIIVTLIKGWGMHRDEVLMRHKILINLGYTSCAKIMEQIRCNRCILNKIIVISDTKIDQDYILGKYVIFEEYNNIINKIIDVYNNYDEYYKKLFSNFDKEKIQEIDDIQQSYLSILQ